MTKKTRFTIDLLIAITVIVTVILICNYYVDKPKFDYYMQLDKDVIYLIDKKGDTIHIEQMNWDTPNKLQQSLIKDNL